MGMMSLVSSMNLLNSTVFAEDGKQGYGLMEGDVFELLVLKLSEFNHVNPVMDTSATLGAILNGCRIPRDSPQAMMKVDTFFGKLSLVRESIIPIHINSCGLIIISL